MLIVNAVLSVETNATHVANATVALNSTNSTQNATEETFSEYVAKRTALHKIEVDGKEFHTTNVKKIPLWKKIAESKAAANGTANFTILTEEQIEQRKKEQKEKLRNQIDNQLKENMKYLNDVQKFSIEHAKKEAKAVNVTKEVEHPDKKFMKQMEESVKNGTFVDYDIPKRFRNPKSNVIVKKVYKKRAEKKPRVVQLDMLEEEMKRKKARKLIQLADSFIQDVNADEFKLDDY